MALTKVIGDGIGTVTNQFADANMSTGSIIQSTELSSASDFATSSTSYVDTTYLLSITPSSTSSKILILSTIIARADGTGDTVRCGYRWVRRVGGSDTVITNTDSSTEHIQVRGSPTEVSGVNGYMYVDSPSTTSAVTYVCQTKKQDDTGLSFARTRESVDGGSLILMEIKG